MITLQAKLVAALLLVGLLAGSNWYSMNAGKRLERADWLAKEVARKDAEAIVLLRESERNLRIQQDQEAKARKVSHAHQTELTAVRDYQPGTFGLRVPKAICDGIAGSAQASGTGRSDGAVTESIELPKEIGSDLRQLAKDADSVTAICRALQNWALENGFYGPAGIQSP